METLKMGDVLIVRDAGGRQFQKRALGPAVPGHDFMVIWMCSEAEWTAAKVEGRDPEGAPWPVEDVEGAVDALV
jgi:hypothetical protein